MKKLAGVIIAIALLLACAAAAADVALDENYFEDPVFKEYLSVFDTNQDGILQVEEIGEIWKIDCSQMGITSLKGIEHLYALQVVEAHDNQITEADFSKNPGIVSISLYSNLLKNLNVSQNTNLEELGFSNNKVTSIKLPNAKNLRILDATSNSGLKELDISNNPLLIEAVTSVEPTDYIYWDGGYGLNWIIDDGNRYIFFAADKWVKVKANGQILVQPAEVEEFRYGGLRYSVNYKNKTASVIGVTDKKATELTVIDTFDLANKTFKVTGIDAGALRGLKKLKKLTIGRNVTSIGKNACNGCKKLESVTILGKKLKRIGAGAFKGTSKKATYRCPKSKLSKYKKMLIKAGANKNSTFTGE